MTDQLRRPPATAAYATSRPSRCTSGAASSPARTAELAAAGDAGIRESMVGQALRSAHRRLPIDDACVLPEDTVTLSTPDA
jgi:hypothetical protein